MFLDRKCESSRSQIGLTLISSLLVFLLFMCSLPLGAQSPSADGSRRIKLAVKPEYSTLAKRLNLSGVVRVEVSIGADGKVKKTHVLGGHPVLAIDAEKAAMMTEFEPGPKESTQILEFHFSSGG